MKNDKTLAKDLRDKLYELVNNSTARRVAVTLKINEATIARAIAGLRLHQSTATQIEVSLKQEATKEKDRK